MASLGSGWGKRKGEIEPSGLKGQMRGHAERLIAKKSAKSRHSATPAKARALRSSQKAEAAGWAGQTLAHLTVGSSPIRFRRPRILPRQAQERPVPFRAFRDELNLRLAYRFLAKKLSTLAMTSTRFSKSSSPHPSRSVKIESCFTLAFFKALTSRRDSRRCRAGLSRP